MEHAPRPVKLLSGDRPVRGLLVAAGLGPVLLLVGIVFLASPTGPNETLILAALTLVTSLLAMGATALSLRHLEAIDAARKVELAKLQQTLDERDSLMMARTAELRRKGAANEELALIVRITESAIVVTDSHGLVTWVNEAFVKTSGYSLNEMLGRKPGERLQGSGTDPATVRYLSECVRDGKPFRADILNYHKNGQSYWAALDGHPIYSPEGRLQKFVAVQTNVTALKEARDRLASLVSSVDGIVWEADVSTLRFTFVSDRAVPLLGYPVAAWLQPNFWADHLHPEDREQAMAFCAEETQLMRTHRFEYRMVAADGRVVWIHDVASVVCESGYPRYLRGIMVDVTEQKEVALARQASEARFQAIFRAVPECIKITDRQGRLLEMNATGLAMLEADSIDQVKNLGFGHFIRPENQSAVHTLHEQTAAGGPGGRVEFLVTGLKGAERWLESIFVPMPTSGREKGMVLSVTRDITERRAVEVERFRMEQRLRSAVVASRLVWWEWAVASGDFGIHASGAPCILGYTTGQLAGLSREGWLLKTHPADRAMVARSLQDILTGKVEGDWVCEHRLAAADGSWRWVRNIGRVIERSPDGTPLLVTGTTQDVDEHQRNVERIRQDRERLQLTLRASRMGIWRFNLQTQVSEWDERMDVIYGFPAGSQSPTREKFTALVHPGDRSMFAALWKAVEAGQAHIDCEFRISRTDGAERSIRLLGSVQNDEQGQPEWVTAVSEDITERVQAEANRRQLTHQLVQSQKMETLGTLAGGIAHDFNNLLTGVMGFVDLSLLTLPPGHAAEDYLKNAYKGGLRARDLVKRLLLFAQRSPTTERRPLSMIEAVTEAAKLMTASVPATISISLECRGKVPLVHADATQIQQVLMNLMVNGAHAIGDRPGQITLGVKSVLSAEAGGIGASADGYVCVTVSDTGCGMDADTQAKIFDPFFTSSKPGEGTGLGLSIVHGIVHDHGGHIRVESAPGQGARFEVYLPALPPSLEHKESEPAQIEAVLAVKPPTGVGGRILVVDDEESVREFVRAIGIRVGFPMEVFQSGREAERRFAEAPEIFSLVLVDLSMPERTGWEVIATLRRLRPELPAILMSGDHGRHPVPASESAGVRLLTKPFSAEGLVAAIRSGLNVG